MKGLNKLYFVLPELFLICPRVRSIKVNKSQKKIQYTQNIKIKLLMWTYVKVFPSTTRAFFFMGFLRLGVVEVLKLPASPLQSKTKFY